MDNNNYQPQFQQPQYQQPVYQQQYYQNAPYQQPTQAIPAPAEATKQAKGAFGKALASLIIPPYPILSVVTWALGSSALNDVYDITEFCNSIGCGVPGILKAARILAKIGKGFGIAFTIIWSLIVVLYAFAFALILVTSGSF